MKRFTIFMLSCWISLSAMAQSPDVQWGENLRLKGKAIITDIIGEDETGFFVLKATGGYFSSGKMWLERYASKDMSLQFSEELKFPVIDGRTANFEELLYVNGQLILFTSLYNKEAGENRAYAQLVSNKGELGPHKEIDLIKAEKKKNNGTFNFTISDDQKSILVSHNDPFAKQKNETFSYKLYDTQLNLSWAKNFKLPYKDISVKISEHVIDQQGNIYMLAKLYEDREKKDKKLKDVPSYHYVIIAYYPAENKLKEFDISLGNKWITSVTFDITHDGDLAIGGFYSNNLRYSIVGTFFLTIDQTSKAIKSKGLKAFDKQFLMEFMNERKVDRGNELEQFYFDHFILKEDGGAVFVAEQYYTYTTSYVDPRTGAVTYTYHYFYDDLIAVSINPDGSIAWARKIPKRQHTSNDGGYFSSYALAVTNEYVHIVFNDNPYNQETYKNGNGKLRSMSNPKKSMALLASLDHDGNIKRKPLFKAQDIEIILRPQIYYQPSGSEVTVFGQKGRNYKFGRIKLD